MKKFEYKEPEFKVVIANTEDVLTLSNAQTAPWLVGDSGIGAGTTTGMPGMVPMS